MVISRLMPLDWRGKSREGGTPSVVGSVLILEPNPRRIGATFVNIGAGIVYLSKSVLGVVAQGIPLNAAGGSYEINLTNPYYGAISIAAGAAGNVVCWTEDE